MHAAISFAQGLGLIGAALLGLVAIFRAFRASNKVFDIWTKIEYEFSENSGYSTRDRLNTIQVTLNNHTVRLETLEEYAQIQGARDA